MDRNKAKEIGRAIEEALGPVAKKFGLVLSVRGGVYSDTSYKPRIEFKSGDHDRKEFDRWASLFGLKPEDLGREFSSNGTRYRISGIRLSSGKYPIIGESITTGRRFKFTEEAVKRGLQSEGLKAGA